MNTVVPRISTIGVGGELEERRLPRLAVIFTRFVVHRNGPDDGDFGQAGLLCDLPQDGLFQTFIRQDPSRRHLGAGFGRVDMIEDKELRGGPVTEDVGGDADSWPRHPSIIPRTDLEGFARAKDLTL